MMMKTLLTSMVLCVGLTLSGHADVITPTGATSTTTVGGDRIIDRAIDGSGLSDVSNPGSVLDDTHVYGAGSNIWLSASSAVAGGVEELTFDLGGTYDVDTVYHWPYTRDNNRNLLTFDISYSTNGGASFTTPVSAASLGMANWGIQANDRSPSNVETRTFSTLSGATHIRFSNLTTHGSTTYIALGELRFGGQELVTPAGPVDAGNSTVVASPTAVLADGISTSTITVTLKDASGIAVSAEEVSLANTSGPGSPLISPSSTRMTNSSGVAIFTVSSDTVGSEVFTATSSTDSVVITQTASIDFQAVPVVGPVDAGNSTVVASPSSVPANGSATSTITVTLKDAAGLAVAEEAVSLENTSGPQAATVVPIDVQSTDVNGQATYTVSSSTIGVEVFTANALGAGITVSQTASVVFTEVAANQLIALLPPPIAASTSASYSSSGTVVENLYDTNISLDFIGTTTNAGGLFMVGEKDSDGYAGDSVKSFTVVYDMGEVLTFNGFVHAQRHESDFSSVGSIDFWTTNTDPGSDFTAIANTYFGTTPQASKTLDRGDRNLHEYVFDGAKLTGRYVVMRWICYDQTDTGSPGGSTFLLGKTASVNDFDTWSADYSGLGLPGQDDDSDGMTNDEERLFGLNPQNSSSANPFETPFAATTGTFTYTRRTQPLTGFTYKTWYSTDLEEWFWDSSAIEVSRTPVGNVEKVDVTVDSALLDHARLFVRVSAEDLGPPPVISSLWGSNSTITLNFSEEMGASAANPGNYSVQEDGGGTVSVSGAVLSGNGKTVTLTLSSPLGIGRAFTVTTNRIANGVGQPLGNGTSGQFQTWDNDPNGVKVFILAGQSNMVGYGRSEIGKDGVAGAIGSLRYLANNNTTYPEYDYTSLLQDPSQPATSAWATSGNLKFWWRNGASGNPGGTIGMGDLAPVFGKDAGMFGPEYAFGRVIHEHYGSDDVLIIKAAWGGRYLYKDFRPPSAVAARGGEVGPFYEAIFNDAREVLLNLDTVFPEWSGRGYQIVGFAWHQGFSDKSPIERATEYKYNLPDFIHDVRAEFGKPDLPFVIASTGMNDVGSSEPYPYPSYSDVEKAQLWAFPEVPIPDNVLSEDTRDYWESAENSPFAQGYHWNHNARSYFRVGKSLGDNMVTLLPE